MLLKFNMLNSIKNLYIKNLCNKCKNILLVYFTSFPYYLYNESNNNSNMAFVGIGIGLIYSQQLFWISNFGITIFIYNKNNLNYFYINYFLLLICIFLYKVSILKCLDLIKYLEKTDK